MAESTDGMTSYAAMGYQINSKYSSEEEKLKRRLRFFFLNPVEKWVATKRFPFKLFFQIVKIILVTLQVKILKITLNNSSNNISICIPSYSCLHHSATVT